MGERVESQTLGMEGRDRKGRQGTSNRKDEWSNKMLTEAVDMTIWLAESVDWLSHVQRRMATKTPELERGCIV
jgi:hypothetical protein